MNIHTNNSQLERIGSEFKELSIKFLRLGLNQHLTWKHHLAHVKNEISRTILTIK